MDVPKCVFVIGVASEMIERGIEVRYKNEGQSPISGRDYIEKIIQVPFTLPPISEDEMIRFIESLEDIGEDEKRYSQIVARGTGCNPRRVKMFLNILRLRQKAAKRPEEKIKPDLPAKLFVIEYTFDDFYEDVVNHRKDNFIYTFEKLAKGEIDQKESEKLKRGSKIISEAIKKYEKEHELTSLLRDDPSFLGIDIEPYIYLSAKTPEIEPEIYPYVETSEEVSVSTLEELLSLDPTKREHALSTIEKIPDAVDRIITRLKSKDEIGRRMAVEALGIIGDAKAVGPLIEILTDTDEKEGLRWKAVKALGKLKEAAEPLIGILKEAEEPKTLEFVAMALGDIGKTDAVGPLIQVLEDENEWTRARAAEALGKMGDSRAIEPLKDMAMNNDETERVRSYANEALKKCKKRPRE